MMPTMYAADGIGLAAPQVAHNIRICTIGKAAIKAKHILPQEDLVLVNPVWIKTGLRKVEDWEGCLSVPKKVGKVKRYKNIMVKAWDRLGNPLSFPASDMLARVVQHEVDHLDGILFIDKAKDIQDVE
jgi:peptide deformylase